MKYELAHHTSSGSRPNNQDRIAHAERDNAVLMAVADGLGGHAGGEIAAEVLTETCIRAFERIKQQTITQPSAFLALTVLQTHNAIVQIAKTSREPIEPRTTCVLCLVQDGYAYWAHVGDSRLYHFRGSEVLTRTLDHTATERLRKDGVLTEEEMLSHPEKSRLLKCLGGPNKPSIAIGEETPLQRGDVLLLCTDGLWEAFSPGELAVYLDVEYLDEGLEETAIEAENRMQGACDNVSAISLRWEDDPPTTQPLQANERLNVDQDALWEMAKNRMLAKKKAPPKKPVPEKPPVKTKARTKSKTPKKSIRTEIEELEKYIRRIEKD